MIFSELLNKYNDFLCAEGISDDEITQAEKLLSLHFATEFKDYLRKYGIAYANKHEFTGLSKSKSLNVVCVTKHARIANDNIPNDWYVIEQLDIDGIVIWQSTTGTIYQTSLNSELKKICDSLAEYISM